MRANRDLGNTRDFGEIDNISSPPLWCGGVWQGVVGCGVGAGLVLVYAKGMTLAEPSREVGGRVFVRGYVERRPPPLSPESYRPVIVPSIGGLTRAARGSMTGIT